MRSNYPLKRLGLDFRRKRCHVLPHHPGFRAQSDFQAPRQEYSLISLAATRRHFRSGHGRIPQTTNRACELGDTDGLELGLANVVQAAYFMLEVIGCTTVNHEQSLATANTQKWMAKRNKKKQQW